MLRFERKKIVPKVKEINDHCLMSAQEELLNQYGLVKEGLPFCGRVYQLIKLRTAFVNGPSLYPQGSVGTVNYSPTLCRSCKAGSQVIRSVLS